MPTPVFTKMESLHRQLFKYLLWPLLALIFASTTLSYFLASNFATQAYDSGLIDSASSLMTQIRVVDGRPRVSLDRQTIDLFQWDSSDRVYFKIATADGEFLAGQDKLPGSLAASAGQPIFFDASFDSMAIRAVTLSEALKNSDQSIFITVAETTNKRQVLRLEILALALIPQLVLLGLAYFLLRTGINKGLSSLDLVMTEVGLRHPADSNPIDASKVVLEIQPLITKFNTLLSRISESIDTQRRFIADASHQLRTPLATLKLQIHNMRARPLPEEAQIDLLKLQHTAEDAAHLTQQFLALARAEASLSMRKEFAFVDLCGLVRSAGENVMDLALAANATLNFEAPSTPVMVYGHTVLLEEMIVNVIHNAIHHGRTGQTVSIEVRIESQVELSVEDQGPGIPALEIPKVFERFYRSPGTQAVGTGLGLAIVREIAEQHDIKVQIRASIHGTGTHFTFRFPVLGTLAIR